MPTGKTQKLHRIQTYFTVAVIIGVAVFLSVFARVGVEKPTDLHISAADCSPTALLVNPCRPWLGAAVGGYTMVDGSSNSQFNFFNKRLNDPSVLSNPNAAVTLNKKMDMPHVYHPQGSNLFSGSVQTVLSNSAFPQIFVNWKPLPGGYKWSDAAGGNTTVDNYIRTAANNVKALGSRKIILALWHEPENDISSGNCASNAAGAAMGSPADYVNMWHNVRNIFNQQGVNNVVWAMNYMGFNKWDCLVHPLWPGNSYVDWIVYDQYASGTESFDNSISRFYDVLTAKTDAAHAFTSKPWGLAEHGYGNAGGTSTETGAINYWNQGKASIDANKYPNIKMWLVFDTSVNGNSQVGFKFDKTTVQAAEQAAFNGFADAIFAKQGGSTAPPPDTVQPAVSITAPAGGSTVSKVITVTASASDNVGVAQVKLYVDDVIIKDDKTGSDGWASQWDTTKVGNGAHTLKATAYDAAGNSRTATISITVSNSAGSPAPPSIGSFKAVPGTITVGSTTTLSWATGNTANCSVTPGGPSSTTALSWQTLALENIGTVTYTLTCKNSAGVTTAATAQVKVEAASAPPSNVVLTAGNTSVAPGTPVHLAWTSTGSTGCTLHPGAYTANGANSSKMINVKETTTFRVTCANNAGTTDSNAVTITVGQSPAVAAPAIVSLTAKPDAIAANGTSVIAWATSNVVADGCRLVPSPLTSVSGNSQWTTPQLAESMSYTLTCKNSAGATASKSISVIVDNKPAPSAPPAAAPARPGASTTAPVIQTSGGKKVVNAQAATHIVQGDLLTLEPSTITDTDKVKSITKIEFYSGSKLIKTVTEQPFALDTAALQPGNYNLTQRTYFADGSTTQRSQIVTIEAKNTATTTRRNSTRLVAAGIGLLIVTVSSYVTVRYAIRRHVLRGHGSTKPFGSSMVPRIIKPQDKDK